MRTETNINNFDPEIEGLEFRVNELIGACERLREENHNLRQQQAGLLNERQKLIEKNEVARAKVEQMIMRLKAMERDS